jgi:hypothetical protein
MSLKTAVQETVDKYYGQKMNVVQIYKDPKVEDCYVVRFNDEQGNWCCVLNFGYVKYGEPNTDSDEAMIEDSIPLEPGQKISKDLFGEPRFCL